MTKPIIIENVEIEGFLSYKNKTTFAPPTGISVLVGENGSGKTSLVEAIYYGILGEKTRTNLDNMVNLNSKRMQVRLTLVTPIGTIEVIRERTKGSGQTVHMIKQNGNTLAIGKENVAHLLAKIITGAESRQAVEEALKTIMDSTIIRQGKITELADILKRDTKEKTELIDRMLGLDSYKRAYDNFAELSIKIDLPPETAETIMIQKEIKVKKGSIEFLQKTINDIKRIIEKEKETLKEKEKEKENKIKERKELEEKIITLNNQKTELEKTLENYEERSKKHAHLTGLLVAKKRELEEIANQIKILNEKQEKIKKETQTIIQNPIAAKEYLYETQKYFEEKETLTTIDKVFSTLTSLEETYIEISKHGLSPTQVNERVKKLNEKIGKLTSFLEEKERLKRELSGLIREKDELEEVFREIYKEVNLILGEEKVSLANTPKKLLELLNKEVIDIQTRVKVLNAKKIEAEETLNNLLNLSPEANKCPVCGRTLTKEHREELIKKLEKEIGDAEKQHEKIKETLESLKKINKKLNEIKTRIEIVDEKILEKRQREQDIERDILVLLEGKTKEELTNEIRRIETLYEDYQRKKQAIEKELYSKSITIDCEDNDAYVLCLKKRLPEISKEKRRKINLLLQNLNSIASKLGEKELEFIKKNCFPEKIDECIRTIDKSIQLLNELQRIKENINQLNINKEKVVSEVSEIEKELEKLGYSEEEHKLLKYRLETLETKLKETQEKVKEIDTQLALIEGELNRSKNKIESYEKILSSLNKALEKLRILIYVRELFNKDNLPRLLRKYAIKQIENELNETLNKFDLTYNEVEIDEKINVKLKSPSGTIELSAASGGETVVFIIAFILALQKVVQELKTGGTPLGFIIFDEPTVFLDEERRKRLIKVIEEFRGGKLIPQLIIVTHDEDLKEASDYIFNVRKTLEGSRIIDESKEALNL